MAGLIWLWQNIPNVTTATTDNGSRPTISVIDAVTPILFVGITTAVFQDESATVNDPVFLVNDPDTLVGGSDNFSTTPTFSAKIDNVKPKFFQVGSL